MENLTVSTYFLLQLIFFITQVSNAQLYLNLQNYGAKPDGKTDSIKPFFKAWSDACNSGNSVTIHVPTGNFLLSRVTFSGPCKNKDIKFVIDGMIVAPSNNYENSGKTDDPWIIFDSVEGVSINGGSFNGKGESLWNCKSASHPHCPYGASSLVFTNSRTITINSMTSINSELFHIVILRCEGVTLRGVNIIAPESSPNTDGIHVERSTSVTIIQANIKTGDDCISVGPGTTHLWVEGVSCGPGHGISIGSLGKKSQGLEVDGVVNVTVKSSVFSGTKNGVRIKTWGTKSQGYVKNVVFVDAMMRSVENPIIIDQYYCPHDHGCPNESSSSGIKISDVKYIGVHGTSSSQIAVSFNCSASNPCSHISLQDVRLSYKNGPAKSYCKNVQGVTSGFVIPPSCL